MRKNAFISYSINDSELFVLSYISRILSERGYDIYSSYNEVSNESSILNGVRLEIQKASLFIGIVSSEGIKSQWVMEEWNMAQNYKVPAIFLIENTIDINPQFAEHNSVIIFNRMYPNVAISQLQFMISKEEQKKSKKSENLIIGGLIGVALMKLFSND